MKQPLIALLMVTLCAGVIFAQTPAKPATASTAAADELKQLEIDWITAQKNKDVTKLAAILADSWTELDPDGTTVDKARALADMKSPKFKMESFEMGPMKVRFFGITAVVTGSDTEKTMANGKDISGKYVWMDVFVKQNGKWKVVASQVAKVS